MNRMLDGPFPGGQFQGKTILAYVYQAYVCLCIPGCVPGTEVKELGKAARVPTLRSLTG